MEGNSNIFDGTPHWYISGGSIKKYIWSISYENILFEIFPQLELKMIMIVSEIVYSPKL